jgi:NADH-quinone oxidoreductase subunit A
VLRNYAFIGVFTIAAITFPLLPLILSRILRPRKPTPVKQSTYECGLETTGDIWVQFKIQYYLYALSFLIFDIEMIFIYPVAVAFGQLNLLAFVAFMLFLIILVLGLIWEWKKGVMEWI